MTNISENDQVVTPEGELRRVDVFNDYPDAPNEVVVTTEGVVLETWLADRLVKVDAPIRVKISRECYAESLVALAEKMGFKTLNTGECEVPIETRMIKFWPKGTYIQKGMGGPPGFGHKYDLTYRGDLSQIEGWLEYHSESEDDECFVCNGSGDVVVDCPNCSDESEGQNGQCAEEPRPEDGEWYEDKEKRAKFFRQVFGGRRNGKNSAVELLDYIDELEQQLSDCWENQQEYKNDVAELQEELQDVREERDSAIQGRKIMKDNYEAVQSAKRRLIDERDNLRERIEEAREKLQHHLPRLNEIARDIDHNGAILRLQGIFDDLNELEILSPDSDERDGCDE